MITNPAGSIHTGNKKAPLENGALKFYYRVQIGSQYNLGVLS